ncbi:hypothetical protein JHL18_22850 [Clostridium sp. YIM B02505]|uniref:Uncharacterized protein n=1 Tax=Clostridium yunnanense TaxID=2800325 RepID=A0ABS1EVU6_9CLOT|nr:hypothetical protein [Clostridium yunnanense]MBK1813460.1 hypothetical protein [Clostridium yunnanense]
MKNKFKKTALAIAVLGIFASIPSQSATVANAKPIGCCDNPRVVTRTIDVDDVVESCSVSSHYDSEHECMISYTILRDDQVCANCGATWKTGKTYRTNVVHTRLRTKD